MKAKFKDFDVYVKLDLCVTAKVRARTLEEAVEIARGLGRDDFVTVPDDVVSWNLEVTGISA